jgi:hypothetical protein
LLVKIFLKKRSKTHNFSVFKLTNLQAHYLSFIVLTADLNKMNQLEFLLNGFAYLRRKKLLSVKISLKIPMECVNRGGIPYDALAVNWNSAKKCVRVCVCVSKREREKKEERERDN